MPPPECASLISNLVLISSCCPLRRIWWQLQLEESFFPFFYPRPPPPAALSFQNKGREKHNLIPCGNVMQLENREGITATLYNIKKSDGLFWFQCWRKHTDAWHLYQLSIHHTRHCRNVMCQIFIIGQCDNIFFSFCFFISFLPVAYVPEELNEAALLDEDVEGEDSAVEEEPALKYVCQDKDLLLKDSQGFHDSPPVDFSSHEMDSESHLSESSDRMSDFESASVKNEEDSSAKELLTSLSSTSSVMMTTTATPSSDEVTQLGPDSLEQMKAIYTSFLTNSYWSSMNLNMSQQTAEKPPRSHSRSSSSSSSSSSCGSGGYDWHQTAVAKTLQNVSQNQSRLLQPSIWAKPLQYCAALSAEHQTLWFHLHWCQQVPLQRLQCRLRHSGWAHRAHEWYGPLPRW